jgi:diguanylate cyclase (GGDEF)-like protein
VAERLRLQIHGRPCQCDAGEVVISVSIGVSELRASDRSLEDAMARADKALYVAKSSGRNRVESAPGTSPPG